MSSTIITSKTTFSPSLLSLLLLLLLPSLIAARCNVFQPLPNATTFTASTVLAPPIAISKGVTCPNTAASCWVADTQASVSGQPLNTTIIYTPIGGIVTFNRTIARSTNANGSTPSNGTYTIDTGISTSVADSLWDIITSSTGMTFTPQITDSFVGDVPSYGMDAGTSGYVAFTPQQRCVRGVLRACSGSGFYQQDTAIEACGPLVSSQGSLQGAYTFEMVSRDQASLVNCWACQLAKLRNTAANGSSASKGLVAIAAVVAMLVV